MKLYEIEIRETLSKKITVEAETKYQAESIAEKKYLDGEIKLDFENCIDKSIKVINGPDENDEQLELF